MSYKIRPKRVVKGKLYARKEVGQSEVAYEKMIADLAEFEEFRATILPALKNDLVAGLSAAELRDKYISIVQARQIADAITTPDAGKAASIAKDLLDRTFGKATERHEVKHEFADITDDELDAIVLSEIEDVKQIMGKVDEQD